MKLNEHFYQAAFFASVAAYSIIDGPSEAIPYIRNFMEVAIGGFSGYFLYAGIQKNKDDARALEELKEAYEKSNQDMIERRIRDLEDDGIFPLQISKLD